MFVCLIACWASYFCLFLCSVVFLPFKILFSPQVPMFSCSFKSPHAFFVAQIRLGLQIQDCAKFGCGKTHGAIGGCQRSVLRTATWFLKSFRANRVRPVSCSLASTQLAHISYLVSCKWVVCNKCCCVVSFSIMC